MLKTGISDSMAMRWITAVPLCSLMMVGCGHGPMRLSEADYTSGNAAMDAIDHEAATNERAEREAWHQAEDIQLEKLKQNLPLYRSLIDYQVAISKIHIARLKQENANLQFRQAELAQSQRKGFAAIQALREAKTEEAQWKVTAKMCRDDAARWFAADVPATGTCRDFVEKFTRFTETTKPSDQRYDK
jgi:hypothetical protein